MAEHYKGTLCDYCGKPIEEERAISIRFIDPKTGKGKEVLVHDGLATVDIPDPIYDVVFPVEGNCGESWTRDKAKGPVIKQRVELSDKLQ